MNAPHEEAVEFAKVSKRENRVYVGNLSYDVKYRDLMEFMRGGGLGGLQNRRCGFSLANIFPIFSPSPRSRVLTMSGPTTRGCIREIGRRWGR